MEPANERRLHALIAAHSRHGNDAAARGVRLELESLRAERLAGEAAQRAADARAALDAVADSGSW